MRYRAALRPDAGWHPRYTNPPPATRRHRRAAAAPAAPPRLTFRRSRHRVLDYCVARHALLMPAHFGAPHCGHVEADGDAYRLAWHQP